MARKKTGGVSKSADKPLIPEVVTAKPIEKMPVTREQIVDKYIEWLGLKRSDVADAIQTLREALQAEAIPRARGGEAPRQETPVQLPDWDIRIKAARALLEQFPLKANTERTERMLEVEMEFEL